MVLWWFLPPIDMKLATGVHEKKTIYLCVYSFPAVLGLSCSFQESQSAGCQSTPALSPGEAHGRRSLVGCSPWGCREVDTTEQLNRNNT